MAARGSLSIGEENQPTFFGSVFFPSLLQQSSLRFVPLSLDASTASISHLLGDAAGSAGLGLQRSGRRPEGLRAHGCGRKEGFRKKEKKSRERERKKGGAVWQSRAESSRELIFSLGASSSSKRILASRSRKTALSPPIVFAAVRSLFPAV